MHNGELNSLINSISKGFYQDIVVDLNESHQSAWSHVEKLFSQPVAKDLVPHYRRAIFEDKMSLTARKHNLIVRSVLNNTKSASHTEIEVKLDSKKLTLTALSVQNTFDLTKLRKAQFRKTLAEALWLFDEFKNPGDGYYGLILHGADAENKDKLSFAHLAFPDPDCEGWFDRYNLFDLAGESTDSEFIEDNVDPRLRTDIIKKVE
jgi:hypothetical protein